MYSCTPNLKRKMNWCKVIVAIKFTFCLFHLVATLLLCLWYLFLKTHGHYAWLDFNFKASQIVRVQIPIQMYLKHNITVQGCLMIPVSSLFSLFPILSLLGSVVMSILKSLAFSVESSDTSALWSVLFVAPAEPWTNQDTKQIHNNNVVK